MGVAVVIVVDAGGGAQTHEQSNSRMVGTKQWRWRLSMGGAGNCGGSSSSLMVVVEWSGIVGVR